MSTLEKFRAALIARLPQSLILKFVAPGTEDDDVVILFTSGSEKDPKAVQLTHRNIWSNIKNFRKVVDFSEEDIILANLPFFHVFGLTIDFWTPISFGITAVCYANPTDYKNICRIIKAEKPTIMVATPVFLAGYLHRSKPGDFSSLRLVVSGADKCPKTLRKGFLEKHGIELYEGYGATETSPVVSVNYPGNNKPGSIGKVIPNVQVRIENYESGEECKPNESGKILVKGDLVMKGYFDDLEETSMRIRHGWYDTGDMGYFDEEGYLWHTGRLKRFVKIGGEMISLVKVEDVLQKNIPDEILCCVVEIPDARKGAKIIAVVTQEVDVKQVRQLMSEELPNIAIPSNFVVIAELPKMGSGKIDFRGVTESVHDLLRPPHPPES